MLSHDFSSSRSDSMKIIFSEKFIMTLEENPYRGRLERVVPKKRAL